jgi:phospholipid transport system transporter-binding protein
VVEKLDAYVHSEGSQLIVSGPVTYDNVVKVMQTGVAAMDQHDLVIDLSKITTVDSAAVSLLLEWVRAAQARDRQLGFINLPENLASLVELYDVTALLPIDTQPDSVSA